MLDTTNPALVNPPPLDALGKIARYMFRDEQKHYTERLLEETGEDIDMDDAMAHARANPDGEHIFCALVRVHDWLWPEHAKPAA